MDDIARSLANYSWNENDTGM